MTRPAHSKPARPGASPEGDAETLLELHEVDKRFPGTHALKAVSLSLRRGETHGIVGENGAGKSMLIKILTGAHQRDGGTVLWQGRNVALRSPLEAQALGINAVHQEVALAPALTVAENIFLGDEPTRLGMVRGGVMLRRAQALLDDLGFRLSARRRLGDLTIGQQQLVATAQASARGTKLLIFEVASGNLRLTANQTCWPAQEAMERRLTEVFAAEGVVLARAHPYDETAWHGFISSQRMGMDVFRRVPKDVPVVVAEAVWQCSHHVLAGLRDHRAPILTVANWSGEWPGLVGMLNLNGSLTKAGVPYSTLWSEDFSDDFFRHGLREWLETGRIEHDRSHVHAFSPGTLTEDVAALGSRLARGLREDKAILGVFDEGCMGMYNALIDDELLNPLGVYKERLSQSALLAEMRRVTDDEAHAVRRSLGDRGVTFVTGADEEADLTDAQLLEQGKMYVAAVRMGHAFGCDAVGIQYQQGLKDMAPASDLVEGLLNNPDRPPVFHAETGDELYPGQALPHFNEVDECAAVDALVTNRVATALGFDPSTTLHDLRWGEHYRGEGIDAYVWVFEISGAAPASHFVGGYAGASSERQPPMYFPLGGGTLKGISKPGEIVWSRVFVRGALHADVGRAKVVELPEEETQRRWQATTPQWPIMHVVLHGVSRDQMMGRHKANHIQVVYAPSAEGADRLLGVKAAMFAELELSVSLCGVEVKG